MKYEINEPFSRQKFRILKISEINCGILIYYTSYLNTFIDYFIFYTTAAIIPTPTTIIVGTLSISGRPYLPRATVSPADSTLGRTSTDQLTGHALHAKQRFALLASFVSYPLHAHIHTLTKGSTSGGFPFEKIVESFNGHFRQRRIQFKSCQYAHSALIILPLPKGFVMQMRRILLTLDNQNSVSKLYLTSIKSLQISSNWNSINKDRDWTDAARKLVVQCNQCFFSNVEGLFGQVNNFFDNSGVVFLKQTIETAA